MRWWLVLLVFVFSFAIVSAVRINEVMPNPEDDCNDCTEWIEIYNENPITLDNWTLNTTNQKLSVNYYLEDFLIITKNKTVFLQIWQVNPSKVLNWSSLSLTNSGKSIFLLNNESSLIDNVSYPDFSTKSNKSYFRVQNLSWVIGNSTPCSENIFIEPSPISSPAPEGPSNTSLPVEDEEKISLEIFCDDKLYNDDELEVEVKAKNLENKEYEIKAAIMFEDEETIVSETYNSGWKSSMYYIPFSENVRLRLKKDFRNISGDAEILVKIRERGKSAIIYETSEEIRILRTKVKVDSKLEVNNAENQSIVLVPPNQEAIVLGSKEEVVYESKNEKIKQYTVYAFCMFLIVLIGLILIKR